MEALKEWSERGEGGCPGNVLVYLDVRERERIGVLR